MRLWCGLYRPVDRATVVECSGLAYRSSANSLGDKPSTEDREDVRLLFGCQGMPFGDRVPFLNAATSAGFDGMLTDKDRVISHWGLFAVIRWIGGSETLLDELLTVQHYGVQPLALQVFPFSGTEAESATEGRTAQPLEEFIQVAVHRSSPLSRLRQSFVPFRLPPQAARTLAVTVSLQVLCPRIDFRGVGIRFKLFQQPVQFEPTSEHRQLAFRRPGPRFLRAVPIQFYAVVVRVTQVKGFADAVVAGTVQSDTCDNETTQGVRKRPPGGIEDGDVVEPRGARRRGQPAQALPGIQPNVVMVAASRDECRLSTVPLRQLEAENSAEEPQRPFQV